MEATRKIAFGLTIIGALNWGVLGLFHFDVVAQLAGGSTEPIARFLYIILGISGLFSLGILFGEWRHRDTHLIETPVIESKEI